MSIIRTVEAHGAPTEDEKMSNTTIDFANDIELLNELGFATADSQVLAKARRLAARHGIDASDLSTTRCEPFMEIWDGARYDGGPTFELLTRRLGDDKRQQHSEAKLWYILKLVSAVLLPGDEG